MVIIVHRKKKIIGDFGAYKYTEFCHSKILQLCRFNMAIPVVEFSRKGYKIRKIFG